MLLLAPDIVADVWGGMATSGPAVLHSQSDLWHHLGDIHSAHKPDAGKKRQGQWGEGEDEQIETSGAAKRKRPRLQGPKALLLGLSFQLPPETKTIHLVCDWSVGTSDRVENGVETVEILITV